MTAALVFLGMFALGLLKCAPCLLAGDAPELACVATVWGVAHPPGYPLWTVLAHLFTGFPLATPAFRATMLSIIGWAGGAVVLGETLKRRWGAGPDAARVGYGVALLLSLGPLAMGQAEGAEVYGLHFLFSALLLHSVLFPSRRSFFASAFLIGLALAHHHLVLVVLPAWGWVYRERLSKGADALRAAAWALPGLSLYLTLPLRSVRQPFTDWGHPANALRFWATLTRHQYGGDIAKGLWADGFWAILHFVQDYLVEGLFLLAVLFLAGVFLRRKEWRSDLGALLGLLGAAVAVPWLIHASPNPENFFLMDSFFPPVLVWSAPWVLEGFRELLKLAPGAPSRRILSFAPPALAILRVGLALSLPGASVNVAVDRLGRDLLLNLPQGACLYSSGDTNTFPLAYLLGVDRLRGDLEVYDRTGGMFKDLYNLLDPRIPLAGNPTDLVRMEMERDSESPSQEVFYTESDDVPGRLLSVYGLVFRLSRDGGLLLPTRDMWERFRVPVAGPSGDFLAREAEGRYFVFRAANGGRAGAPNPFVQGDFRRGTELGYDNPRLLNNIGLEYLKAGWMNLAMREFQQCTLIDDRFFLGWYNQAVVAERKKSSVDAERFYRKCISVAPYYSQARDGLAVVLYRVGRVPEAVEEWKELIRRDPSFVTAYRNLGMALFPTDRNECSYLLHKYLMLSPGASDAPGVAGFMKQNDLH